MEKVAWTYIHMEWRDSRGREYMYNHGWFKLLYGRTKYNTVKKLLNSSTLVIIPNMVLHIQATQLIQDSGSPLDLQGHVNLKCTCSPMCKSCTLSGLGWLSQCMLGNCKELPISSPPLFSVSKVYASSNLEVLNMRSTGELQGLWDSLGIA